MQEMMRNYLDGFVAGRKKYRRIVLFLLVLSVFVGLSVFWRLKIIGVAMTDEAACGYTEHTHTEECYERQLVCGLVESETPHTHSEELGCYEVTKTLTCAAEEHTHGEGCYTYETVLDCGCEEHTHSGDCYAYTTEQTCGLEEHTHSDGCYDADGNLICSLEEHTHSDDCYTEVATLVCTLAEHTHTDDCYTEIATLVCEQEEHTHSDDCYIEERTLVCQMEEGATHTHTEECYADVLACGLEEHTHTTDCYCDPSADLESGSDWEAALPDTTGVWADDMVAIANSQLGYAESTRNFQMDGSEERGYTRYGEWYGNPYGSWDAMFVSFCMYYSDITSADIPYGAGAYAWSVALQDKGLWADASHTPEPGDVVFLDTDDTTTGPDTVGVVTAVSGNEMTVVAGDYNNAVAELTGSTGSDAVYGYCPVASLQASRENTKGESYTYTETAEAEEETTSKIVFMTEAEDETEEEADDSASGEASGEIDETASDEIDETASGEIDDSASGEIAEEETESAYAYTQTVEGEDYTVTVQYNDDAAIPEGAELQVVRYEKDSDEFITRQLQAGYELEWLFDIGFYLDGEEVEPAAAVSVTITADGVDGTETITHFVQDGEEEYVEVLETSTEDGAVAFETGSFSPFAAPARSKTVLRDSAVGISDDTTGITYTVTISEMDTTTNETSGRITITITGSDGNTYTAEQMVAAGYNITWTKTASGSTTAETLVNGYNVTVNSQTVQAVDDNGQWVNVAYTDGAQATYTVTITKTASDGTETTCATESKTISEYDELQNGSFEAVTQTSAVAKYSNSDYKEKGVWQSTAEPPEDKRGQDIEICNTTNAYFTTSYNWNAPVTKTNTMWGTTETGIAADGDQIAELNAESAGALYQDVLTVPGQKMSWWLSHHARGNNKDSTPEYDTMYLVIAPYSEVSGITTQTDLENYIEGKKSSIDVSADTHTSVGNEVLYNESGVLIVRVTSSDQAWQYVSGTNNYTPTSAKTRFFFVAGTTASGSDTVGNFLDKVGFSQTVPPAAENEAKLTVTKTVYGLSENDAKTLLQKTNLLSVAVGSESSAGIELGSISSVTNSDGVTGYQASYTITEVTSGRSVTFKVSEDSGEAAVDGYTLDSTTYAVGGTETTTADDGKVSITVNAGSTKTVTITNTYTASPELVPVNFYIRLDAAQVDTQGNVTGRNVNAYTKSVAGSEGSPRSNGWKISYQFTNLYILEPSGWHYQNVKHNSAVYYLGSAALDSGLVGAEGDYTTVDTTIRNLASASGVTMTLGSDQTVAGAGATVKAGTYTYKLVQKNDDGSYSATDFPSDESIFSYITNNWDDTGKKVNQSYYGVNQDLTVSDGAGGSIVVDPSWLTTAYFQIRWYVFKDHDDGWHIDGLLVAKSALLTVTKTFDNAAEAAAAEASDFTISITGNFRTLSATNTDQQDTTQTYKLKEVVKADSTRKTVNGDGTVTYTIVKDLPVYTGEYVVEESGEDTLTGYKYISVDSKGTGVESGHATSVKIHVDAVPADMADYDNRYNYSVSFTNHYDTKVKIEKIASGTTGTSATKLSGAVFTLSKDVNGRTYYYSEGAAAESDASGANWTATQTNADKLPSKTDGQIFEGYLADGNYTLTEVSAPDGYMKLTESVTITVEKGSATAQMSGGGGTGVSVLKKGAEGGETDSVLIQVTNETGDELPMTGGYGVLPYTIAGLALMLTGLGGMAIRRRKRRAEG